MSENQIVSHWTSLRIVQCSACKLNMPFSVLLANLTGHTERVGIENFELLKVLGTGGKSLHSL